MAERTTFAQTVESQASDFLAKHLPDFKAVLNKVEGSNSQGKRGFDYTPRVISVGRPGEGGSFYRSFLYPWESSGGRYLEVSTRVWNDGSGHDVWPQRVDLVDGGLKTAKVASWTEGCDLPFNILKYDEPGQFLLEYAAGRRKAPDSLFVDERILTQILLNRDKSGVIFLERIYHEADLTNRERGFPVIRLRVGAAIVDGNFEFNFKPTLYERTANRTGVSSTISRVLRRKKTVYLEIPICRANFDQEVVELKNGAKEGLFLSLDGRICSGLINRCPKNLRRSK